MTKLNPGTPEWWSTRLRTQLREERKGGLWERTKNSTNPQGRPGLDLLHRYISGEPPLTRVSQGWRETMRPYIRKGRLNVAELVVSSASDRVVPMGWVTSVENDIDGDSVAADVAAENGLPIVGADLSRHVLTYRRSHLMLSAPRPGSEVPTITAEDPRFLVVESDQITGQARAALKEGVDEWTGKAMWWLFLPGRVHVARSGDRGGVTLGPPQALPTAFSDSIPIYTAVNRDGVGEFERHLDTLDRINDGIFERLIIAKYQAFRQRAVKGLPEKDETGAPADYSDVFTADPGALWQLPPGAEMWESQNVDLGPLRMAIKDDLEHLAAATSTPLHMINPDAASGSAAGAETMREGNTFRIRDRRRRVEVALNRAVSDALRVMGHEDRSKLRGIRTIWEPTEVQSVTSRAAAMRDAAQGGVPFEVAAVDFGGFSPADLPRLRGARATDLLFQTPGAPSGTA